MGGREREEPDSADEEGVGDKGLLAGEIRIVPATVGGRQRGKKDGKEWDKVTQEETEGGIVAFGRGT